jgi:hypothetical protein
MVVARNFCKDFIRAHPSAIAAGRVFRGSGFAFIRYANASRRYTPLRRVYNPKPRLRYSTILLTLNLYHHSN